MVNQFLFAPVNPIFRGKGKYNRYLICATKPQAVYPKIEDTKTIKADSEIRETVSLWQETSLRRKELEKQEEKLKIEIQSFMGDAGILDAGFCKVALKERTATRLDTCALKEAMPQLYREYSNDNTYRILQIIGG